MYVILHIMYPLFLSDFIKIEFSQHCFEKYSNVNSHENPSIGSRVVACGQMDSLDMTSLIVAFPIFQTRLLKMNSPLLC